MITTVGLLLGCDVRLLSLYSASSVLQDYLASVSSIQHTVGPYHFLTAISFPQTFYSQGSNPNKSLYIDFHLM